MSSSILPPNWAELTDPDSGSIYFYNSETMESSWLRPDYYPDPLSASAAAPPYSLLPPIDFDASSSSSLSFEVPVYVPPLAQSSSRPSSASSAPPPAAAAALGPSALSSTVDAVGSVFRSASVVLWGATPPPSDKLSDGRARSASTCFHKRSLSDYTVNFQAANRRYAVGLQPNLKDRRLVLGGYFETEALALAFVRHNSPVKWVEADRCALCDKSFALLVRPHHCRNCGAPICADCSPNVWPSKMVPSSYHSGEKQIRVCKSCQLFMERFRAALLAGKEEEARAVFSTGNVNLNEPYAIYPGVWYPVHCAAKGGNLALMRW